jgi:hypothetical protein
MKALALKTGHPLYSPPLKPPCSPPPPNLLAAAYNEALFLTGT